MLSEVVDMSEPKRLNLPMNDKHRVLKWGDGEVYISYTKKGEAISMHIAADKGGKKHLRRAANEFCDAVFQELDWCRMIIGIVGSRSVANLAKKCGFETMAKGEKDGKPAFLMARKRECHS